MARSMRKEKGRTTTGRRLCDAEVLSRREKVRLALLDESWTPATRARLCDEYDVSDAQLRRDRQIVEAELFDGTDKEGTEARARLVARNRHTFHLSIVAGEYGAAVAATREEAKLMGAYAPERREVAMSGSVTLELLNPAAEARAIYEAFEAACQVLGVTPPVLPALPLVIDVEPAEAK